MKIAIRMGHLNGGVDGAATGLINEYDVIRSYAPYVISALQRAGIDVIDVTPETADSVSQSLGYGCDRANEENADLFVLLHANCFSPNAQGCTGYCNSSNTNGVNLMNSILTELSNLGFSNRGYMNGYSGDEAKYEIKYTDMTAVIVEPFFITNQDDVNLYNQIGCKALGEAIAKGILNYLNVEFVPEKATQEVTEDNSTDLFFQVYGGKLEVHFNNSIGIINFDEIVKKG